MKNLKFIDLFKGEQKEATRVGLVVLITCVLTLAICVGIGGCYGR